jgi:cytochrome c oxidase subunit 2
VISRGIRLIGAILLLALTGCSGWQSALDAHGSSAVEIKQLIILIVAICSVVWMLVMLALLRALWRGGSRVMEPLHVDPALQLDQAAERRSKIAVSAAVLVTAVIVGGFTVASYVTTRAISTRSTDELTIKVRGLQWWWGIEYVGATSDERFETANEIHIPVGRDIRLQLEGLDVIHSFWVPSLAGKQDLIPGRPNDLRIRADRPGIYRGQCAEFCGMQHAHMAFIVIAEDQAQFDQWAAGQRLPAPSSAVQEIAAGREVFLSKQCAACHTIRGTDASGKTGPDLTHVGSRKYIASGLFETTRGSLAAWIADPQTLKPGNNMPMVPLTAEELRSVSAFMASLK